MARVFNQHADAGKFHLEIRFVDADPKHWEWFAVDAKKTSDTKFSGESNTLAGAKKSAAGSVGLVEAQWKNIGPASEAPHELLGE